MNRISVKSIAVLDAPAEAIYHTIADYKNGHPLIVSRDVFSPIEVEQGGYGAGTVIRFEMKMLGLVRKYHQRISEPEPGRVLVEHDIASAADTITTFTVDPLDDGKKARVSIETTLLPTPGPAGLFERLAIPILTRPLYEKELKTLASVAQKQHTSV